MRLVAPSSARLAMASRLAARLPDRSPSLRLRLGEVAHGDGDERRVPELAIQRRGAS